MSQSVVRSNNIFILIYFILQVGTALLLLLTIDSCQGMTIKNTDGRMNRTFVPRHSDHDQKAVVNVKAEMEQKFNHTVEKVVEAKMFLMGVLAHTFNKTVDKLMEAKQQIEGIKGELKEKLSSAVNETGHKWDEMKKKKQDIKEDIKEKFVVTVNQTGHKLEEMKHDLHDYKMTKAAARHHQQPTHPVVFVTHDFVALPEFQIVKDVLTQPQAPFTPTSSAPLEADQSAGYSLANLFAI